jgi:hypothetical protein
VVVSQTGALVLAYGRKAVYARRSADGGAPQLWGSIQKHMPQCMETPP